MSDIPKTYLQMVAELGAGRVGVPDSWRQGRTAYGGLTAGLCVAAAQKAHEMPELRSVMMNFTGPVTADPAFDVRVLRRGRNVTSAGVEVGIETDGARTVVGNALLVFGMGRDSVLDADCAAPDVESPGDCEPLIPPGGEMFAPNFIRSFEVRLAGGHRPVSGAAEGRTLCWARHRDPLTWSLAGPQAESAFVCLGDVLPPAAFAMMRAPAPISSVNWTLNLLRTPVSPDGWFLIESVQTAVREGYSSQHMRYWNRGGEMVAEGLQSVAVFA